MTGATGELGTGALLHRLNESHDVRCLSRTDRRDADSDIHWVRGDVTDVSTLAAACEGIDTVLHAAAVTRTRRSQEYLDVNAQGTRNLLVAAKHARVRRFVHMSTRAIGRLGGAYSLSKQIAETEVKNSGLPFVILRPGEIYGGGGPNDAIFTLARWLGRRRYVPVPGDGQYQLCPVHLVDVIDATLRVVDSPECEGRTYLLAGPEEFSYLELIGRLEQLLGVPTRIRVHIPLGILRAAILLASVAGLGALVPDQIPRLLIAKASDITGARQDLGFQPGTLEERFSLEANAMGVTSDG